MRPPPTPSSSSVSVLILGALTLSLSWGCDSSPSGPRAAHLLVLPGEAALDIGEQIQLEAQVLDEDGTEMADASVEWASSREDVATVDASGRVEGVGEGAAVITATSRGASGDALVVVSTPNAFHQISAGSIHTCAVTIADEAFCWGDALEGRLGIGRPSEEDYPRPQRVQGRVGFGFVSAGFLHSCGIGVDGLGYCWGHNFEGQLGDGDLSGTEKYTPEPLTRSAALTALDAAWHSCAVTGEGTGLCWGPDFEGGLGDGGPIYFGHGVVEVAGDLEFTTIQVGGFEVSCGLDGAGKVYCWGDNKWGQLGDGTTTSSTTPVPVAGGHAFESVAVGGAFTCAVSSGGPTYCWGTNEEGQLGNGSTIESHEPTPVSGGVAFQSVAAGGRHVCGIALDGLAYCWGGNDRSQLGDGSTESSATPIPVAGGHVFGSISAGGSHTCGVTIEGEAYCWGWNAHGQLGDGSFENRPTPVRIR